MFSVKNVRLGCIIAAFTALVFTFPACKKKIRSDMGKALFEKSQNKAFKDVTPEGFAPVFKKALEERQNKILNPKVINAYYAANDYDPSLLMEHIKNNDLKFLPAYLERSAEHGLDPKMFQTEKLKTLLAKFYDKKAIKTTAEAYQDMADVEITMANALINYTNALQFGVMNPKRIYANYYTQTIRPDSLTMTHALGVESFKSFLDSIQPKNPQYLTFQKLMAKDTAFAGMTKEETHRLVLVNLERLRWKNKPQEDKYVLVNIPDFQLDVIDKGKSALRMKVCVGEGRNKDHSNTLIEYSDSDKMDRPFSRETPQLNSLIYVAEVNPVWNIPQSIAGKEIMVQAAADPYYLSNKNIDVYMNGKLVDDAETIKWGSLSDAEKAKYSFKQQPGADNSLGKIKFLFKNSSSVYLHDTPAKLAFNKSMRAVSHGCVRLEKPLDFAHALFGDSQKYKTIAECITQDNPKPTVVPLPQKMPVYITYITCWVDDAGQVQTRPDVYGLDIVLYAHLQKFLA